LIARSLAKRMYRDFGSVLGRFQGTLINDLRKKLAAADRKIIASTRQMLRHRIKQSANPPPGIKIGKKSQWTEWGLIENEINKKAKFVPVRDLTARAGQALQELKPCWMMSPLAVAQYIPRGTVEFDLCIIDEASQMRPEDAIGGLVRSKQAMIVGDTNQLPPSNFFRMVNDDEDADEDQTVLEESILELANASFRPKRRLRWHYRSRHSALINFSNRLVYDDDLIVFPSAHEGRKDMGVSLVYVDGVFKSGVNGIESQTMVDAALDFMEQNPHRSLGIVTMNQPQRDLLLEEMEYALVTRKKATDYIDFWSHENGGLESFFIKNLENVQGDERDVIFIGTVYGPAQPGAPVMQRFGPVNGLGGKRRLNVLFTRAKEQIITFSSMTAADVRADENGNPGAYMLKRWLEYSATGVLESGRLTDMEPDSEFEVFVIDQIKAMGYEAIPQIGVSGYFIDIGVKHPSWPHGFILGVECDGASYHSSKSARDRDRLRQEVLEGLGWHFHRIWSTDWFNDTARAALRLRDAITQRLEDLKKEGDKFSQNLPELPSGEVEQPREHDYPGQELGNEQQIVKEENYGPGDGVGPGDTVYVRYLNDPGKTLKVTLSEQKNDPSNGIIGTFEPLGEALLGSEEGEEIDVLIGNIVRRAIVDKVEREQDSDFSLSQYPERNGATPQKTVSNGERSEQLRHSAEGVNSRQEESGTNVQEQNFVLQSPRLDPDAFYNPEYSFTLRELSVRIIDHFGPVTHKHLCQKIARMHGFKRAGPKIKEIIWAIIHKERQTQKDPFGEDIFWPRNQEPQKTLKFRGLEVFGDERPRENVPYPEMLGLALDAISTNNRRENLASLGRGRALDYMVKSLGLGRLTARTKAELEGLLQEAERVKGNDEDSVEAL
jgi:transcription elongation GreA/GreB family factor